MTDEAVIKKAAAIMGVGYRKRDRNRPNTKPSYHARLTGKRAVRLMWRMLPYMSPRRQVQIERAMQVYVDRGDGWHPKDMPAFEVPSMCGQTMCTVALTGAGWCDVHNPLYEESL